MSQTERVVALQFKVFRFIGNHTEDNFKLHFIMIAKKVLENDERIKKTADRTGLAAMERRGRRGYTL